MSSYILSILGIVIAGVLIEIIVPSGSINKYIKSIYSLFVVAVIITPVLNFVSQKPNFKFAFNDYTIDEELFEYIGNQRAKLLEENIETGLKNDGFDGVDIMLEFSIENNTLTYKNCKVNLENLVIDSDKQHINKYEFITKVVKEQTNLTEEEIVFNGEQG